MGVAGRTRWRVISIDPTGNGLAYAVIEGGDYLVDCGLAVGRSARVFKERVDALCDRFRPNILVCERELGSKRGPKARRRIVMAVAVAAERQIPTCKVSRLEVQTLFDGAPKHEIATAITQYFPGLLHRLPHKRSLGMPEDERMNVFDAISFALVVLGKL